MKKTKPSKATPKAAKAKPIASKPGKPVKAAKSAPPSKLTAAKAEKLNKKKPAVTLDAKTSKSKTLSKDKKTVVAPLTAKKTKGSTTISSVKALKPQKGSKQNPAEISSGIPPKFDDLYNEDKGIDDLDEFELDEYELDLTDAAEEVPEDEEKVEAEVDPEAEEEAEVTEDSLNFDDSFRQPRKDGIYDEMNLFEDDESDKNPDHLSTEDDDF